jgi:hypothetical protein
LAGSSHADATAARGPFGIRPGGMGAGGGPPALGQLGGAPRMPPNLAGPSMHAASAPPAPPKPVDLAAQAALRAEVQKCNEEISKFQKLTARVTNHAQRGPLQAKIGELTRKRDAALERLQSMG